MEDNRVPEQAEAPKKKGKVKKTWQQEVWEWIKAIVMAVVIVVVLQSFLFSIIRVEGQSMETTLHDGERLFVNVAEVRFKPEIPRDSIVICHYPNRTNKFLGLIPMKTNFVKRLVGVPGDVIYREDGVTHVVYKDESGNEVDEALDPNFAQVPYYSTYSPDVEPYTLAENEYFAVGDNRYNSHDSRDWRDTDDSNDVGPITKDMVVGRVRQVIWPLNAIRSAK